MTGTIYVEVDSARVLDVLADLGRRAEHPGPALKQIGEKLVFSTKARFDSETGPDGEAWAPNTQVTLDRYLAAITGTFDERGKRTGDKKGAFLKSGAPSKAIAARMGSKKVLDGLTHLLGGTIHYNAGDDFVEVGSGRVYSAMMQFGGTRAQWPHLWGDIPPRPYLGLSQTDEEMVVNIVRDFLAEALP